MALLYQGNKFVRGKIFIKEDNGEEVKLKYIKPTKIGYEFITESEEKVLLKEEELKLLKEYGYGKKKI